ncbi:MAG: ribokinase [Eubacteriales bacterium]
MRRITVVGSLNMDLVVNTPRIPVLGETILGSDFFTAPGGKGANQAVAAAKLGGSVLMVGCVGNDIFGKELLENLSKNNVDVENVKLIDKTPTGITMITVKDGDNFIIVDPGANSKLLPVMIESIEELIKESFIAVIQLEIPFETVEKTINLAKKHGTKVLLNPAPARKIPDELFKKIDIITPNEKECEFLTGIPINSIDDAKTALHILRKSGISQVIITMGSEGVVYNNEETALHKPAYDVKPVDTTAAGDSFTGALAVALSEGKSIDDAVDFANIVGALTVTKSGAQKSLPSKKDVDGFIRRHKTLL